MALFLRKKTRSDHLLGWSFFCWCEDAQEKLEEEIEKGKEKQLQTLTHVKDTLVSGTVPEATDDPHDSYKDVAKEYDVNQKSLMNWTARKRFAEKEKDEEEEAFRRGRGGEVTVNGAGFEFFFFWIQETVETV